MTKKIAVLYNSKHGTTAKVAQEISQKISGSEVNVFDVEKLSDDFDLSKYRLVILGTSIHAGESGKPMKEFCEKNIGMLLLIKSGLFVCGMQATEEAQKRNWTMHSLPNLTNMQVQEHF